ncbi:MAG: lytic transglycosylase domain-containing protein, partial [Deltaproteobacteria bacterium]|nr:lytic transglycosylase domain-containing protein [Deltaproteobacteria bacterium]
PASFVRAIAREESSFDPEVVSWAKAYGLVQLIMPTAKRFASEVGEKATPRTLKKPAVNLKIGARYMAWLWDRLKENPALVPSAYNAGEGAVRRWLQEDAARPLDVFIEEIPYDETRRYTRRVLQTYGVYQWLADEQLPELPAKLPTTSRTRKTRKTRYATTFGKSEPNSIALLMSPSTRSLPCTNAICGSRLPRRISARCASRIVSVASAGVPLPSVTLRSCRSMVQLFSSAPVIRR